MMFSAEAPATAFPINLWMIPGERNIRRRLADLEMRA